MNKKIKLSKTQRELLLAMQAGVTVYFQGGLDAHYFRGDNYKRCSVAVEKLVDRGLAVCPEDFVRLTDAGKAWSDGGGA